MPDSSDFPGVRSQLACALERTGAILAKACLVLAAVSLFVIVGINAANVALRHFLGFAWSWADEAMLFSMIFGVFAGAAAATWQGSHMRLDMFVDRMPAGYRRAAIIFTGLFSVGILTTLANASYHVVSLLYSFGQTSVALGFPMWIAQGCVLVGFILIAAMILLRLAVSGTIAARAEDYVRGPS